MAVMGLCGQLHCNSNHHSENGLRLIGSNDSYRTTKVKWPHRKTSFALNKGPWNLLVHLLGCAILSVGPLLCLRKPATKIGFRCVCRIKIGLLPSPLLRMDV